MAAHNVSKCQVGDLSGMPEGQKIDSVLSGSQSLRAIDNAYVQWYQQGLRRLQRMRHGGGRTMSTFSTLTSSFLPDLGPLLEEAEVLHSECFDRHSSLETLASEDNVNVVLFISQDKLRPYLSGYLAYRSVRALGEVRIIEIAVREDLRGNGYGKQMIQWASAHANALGFAELWMYSLPEFCEKLGFFDMGCSNGDDDDSQLNVAMMLPLKEDI